MNLGHRLRGGMPRYYSLATILAFAVIAKDCDNGEMPVTTRLPKFEFLAATFTRSGNACLPQAIMRKATLDRGGEEILLIVASNECETAADLKMSFDVPNAWCVREPADFAFGTSFTLPPRKRAFAVCSIAYPGQPWPTPAPSGPPSSTPPPSPSASQSSTPDPCPSPGASPCPSPSPDDDKRDLFLRIEGTSIVIDDIPSHIARGGRESR